MGAWVRDAGQEPQYAIPGWAFQVGPAPWVCTRYGDTTPEKPRKQGTSQPLAAHGQQCTPGSRFSALLEQRS